MSKLKSAVNKLAQWKERVMDLSDELYFPSEEETEDPIMHRIRELEEELGLDALDLADMPGMEEDYLAYLEDEAGMSMGAKKAQIEEGNLVEELAEFVWSNVFNDNDRNQFGGIFSPAALATLKKLVTSLIAEGRNTPEDMLEVGAEFFIENKDLGRVSKKAQTRERYPEEYDIILPEYADDGDTHLAELIHMLSQYYSGQGDPIYAFTSRDEENVSLVELQAIESELEDIAGGKYLEQADEGDEQVFDDQYTAKAWLPTIKKLLEELPEERWEKSYVGEPFVEKDEDLERESTWFSLVNEGR